MTLATNSTCIYANHLLSLRDEGIIGLLYRDRIFIIDLPGAICVNKSHFPMATHHLEQNLRHLDLRIRTLPDFRESWSSLWDLVGQMRQLQTLRVFFNGPLVWLGPKWTYPPDYPSSLVSNASMTRYGHVLAYSQLEKASHVADKYIIYLGLRRNAEKLDEGDYFRQLGVQVRHAPLNAFPPL